MNWTAQNNSSEKKQCVPSARWYVSVGGNPYVNIYFFMGCHHIRFTCIVAIWIWGPNIVYLSSSYGKSVVDPSCQARILPWLTKIDICLKFLTLKRKESKWHAKFLINQCASSYLSIFPVPSSIEVTPIVIPEKLEFIQITSFSNFRPRFGSFVHWNNRNRKSVFSSSCSNSRSSLFFLF